MSASESDINLAGDVPNEAIDVADSKPDIRSEYSIESVSGGEDITSEIESASSNNAVLDLGSGEYSMSSGVSVGGDVAGIVGSGSDETVINCETGGDYLFSMSADHNIMEGVTFQAQGDVALATVQSGSRGWFEDIEFLGQRDKYAANGERMTFLIEADSRATNYVHNARFPDGGTNHPDRDEVGHAIGPNADPGHEGLNVWHEVYAANFQDNGFYVAHSPGRNVLWNCTAINNSAGNIRLGNDDIVVGGYSEVTETPDDRNGKPLESDTGANIHVIGLQMYGEGPAVSSGSELIQIRSECESITLDRCVAHANGVGTHLGRFDNADVEINDCWWYQENQSSTSVQLGQRTSQGTVTANDLRLLNEDGPEISGSITIDGSSYSGTTTAEEAGLDDPQPFPEFHFDGVESGQGADYESDFAGWDSDSGFIDGSGSSGSRWGLTEERQANIDDPQEDHGEDEEGTISGPNGKKSVVTEPQWFNR